jgi:4-hydroxy-tetrahydrodipicolinate synthase
MNVDVRSVRGSIVALVTPFTKGGAVDTKALQKLVEIQIKGGSAAISPCGTTGEAPSLSESDFDTIVSTVVETVKGRVPVIVGAGSNNTEHAIHLSSRAEKLGANAILSVAPYYNKPSQEGYYQHFKAIAQAVTIPILLYNVPGRTGSNMEARTVQRLAELDTIYGIKEASGNVMHYMELLKERPKNFMVYSGDDALALTMLALGGDGVVSVAANEVPHVMSGLCTKFFAGDLPGARMLHYRYLDLMNANFIESNPMPVKYALNRLGLIEESYRLPLTVMSGENKKRMDGVLTELELV